VSQVQVFVNEVTLENEKLLSKAEKEKKLCELLKFETDLFQGVEAEKTVIHDMAFSSQKDIMQYWALNLKQQYYLGYYKDPINTISIYIRKQIGRMNLRLEKKERIYAYLAKMLPSEYKQEREKN